MFKRNISRATALAGAVLLLAAACGGDEEPAGDETTPTDTETTEEEAAEPTGEGDGELKLGYIFPSTGNLAFLGPPQVAAAEFAVSQINEAGGVLGNPMPDLIPSDEGDQPAIANQSADTLLAEDVDGIIGAAASGMSLAIIDKVTGAGVAQCSGSNTAPTFTDYDDGGFYVRTAPSDALQGPVLANTIIDDGHVDVAILGRGDDYGRGLADATATALEDAGATVTYNDTFDPQATNFDAPVQEALGTEPDAVVVVAFEEGTQIIKGLLESGFPADGIYGTDGLRNEDLGELVAPGDPAAIAGMKGTAPASADNPDFVSELQEFAPDLEVLQFAPQVYDCVMVMALAAEEAGTDDPAVFKDSLVSVTKDGEACTTFAECRDMIADGTDIDYNGRSGPLDFIDAGEPERATIEIYGFNDAGELESLDSVESEPLG